jgi:quinol monooxygenase YgiN
VTIYEVSIQIDAERAADYRAWLANHVRELLALPGFVEARVFEVEADEPDPARFGLVVHYVLENHLALQHYLQQHAPAMRAKADEHFAGRYSASRRVLNPLCEILSG